jgi:hypothetical protein
MVVIHDGELQLNTKLFATVKCLCEGVSPKQSSVFTRYFNSKEDCQGATKWYAAKGQVRRLAKTSIYEMYGRELNYQIIFRSW